jgi:hypothetical protein
MFFIDKIKKIIKAVDRKIKNIRRSDKKTKRNWLVLSTTITMVLVICLWVWYINLALPSVSNLNEDVETKKSFNLPIVSVFMEGIRVIKNSFSENYLKISNKTKSIILDTKKQMEDEFKNVNEYIIESTSTLENNIQN